MYTVDNMDEIIKLTSVPQPSIGAPLPFVMSDEYRLLLAYLVEDAPLNWYGKAVQVTITSTSNEPLALVEFNRYHSYMFGAPNDEAFSGHPLAGRGLHPYGAFQVQNSSWIRQLESMNSAHPHHHLERFEILKHYIFAFHDSTFECVAEGFTITEHEGSLQSILPEMQKRLQW